MLNVCYHVCNYWSGFVSVEIGRKEVTVRGRGGGGALEVGRGCNLSWLEMELM